MDKFWQVRGKKANIQWVKEALRDMERQDVLDALEDAEVYILTLKGMTDNKSS